MSELHVYARRKRPGTATLFVAIAGEALACLYRTNWEEHVTNIENLVTVIRWRMRRHWEEWHRSELDRLIEKAKEEVSYDVVQRD